MIHYAYSNFHPAKARESTPRACKEKKLHGESVKHAVTRTHGELKRRFRSVAVCVLRENLRII